MSIGSHVLAYNENATSNEDARINTTQLPRGESDWWRELVHSPNWPQLWEQLQWAWNLHIYGLACLFLALACASFFTILGLRAQLSTRPHLTTLNVFLCLLGTARALALFVDPYGSKKAIPLVISRIVWDIGYPCLLSAFALLQLSFLRMSKVKILIPSSRLSGETAASVIVTSHFCLIIMSDILWALRNSFRIVWLLTQVIFVLWGLFLCLTFLCGCLRLLRSVTELPMQTLSQVDPAYESKGILPLGLVITSNSFHESHRVTSPTQQPSSNVGRLPRSTSSTVDNRFGPKIRITDVNEQTFSFASEGTPAVFNEQRIPDGKPKKSVIPSPAKKWSSQHTNIDTKDDPALIRPLIVSGDRAAALRNTMSAELVGQPRVVAEIRPNGPATISSPNSGGSSYVQRNLRQPQSPLDEFKFDARKLKTKHSTRLEKLLRKLVVTSIFGTLLCLLKAYDVFGPHGLSSRRQDAAILPWFWYQTISRIVEFLMGCGMAGLTRQSLYNQSYHYCGAAKKHRDPFCYMNH